MRRNAFTLIELIISIALFGLISIFLFGAIEGLRKQQDFFQKKEELIKQENQILSLLRTDLDRPKSLTVSATGSKDFDTVSINGSNRSLYGIDRPFVMWIILKVDNTLVRLESAYPITLPIRPEALYLIHSDYIAKRCEIFRVYDSPKNRLVYLKSENHSPLVIETAK